MRTKKIQALLKRRWTKNGRWLVARVAIGLLLVVNACATFQPPAAIDETPVHMRAVTKEANGVAVSTALVGDEEARQIFGIDLSRNSIQALWLAIENNTDRPFILLVTAIDPDYYAPLEVAFAYHRSFAPAANNALDEHLLQLAFPVRRPIVPGARSFGYVFIRRTQQAKAVDIDLLGDDDSQNFTFFAPNPNFLKGTTVRRRLDVLNRSAELRSVENENELRRVLEQLPCCVSRENGESLGEPLNVVMIGAVDDWVTAFVRRGYRYDPLNLRFALGRDQDISAKKRSQGYNRTQTHHIRIWQTPIRYRGQPVWVAQTANRLGGRFANEAASTKTLPLDPYVDEARNDLTQDLAYSQALIKIGYVKGAGRPPSSVTLDASMADNYTTDGLRVVLCFADRPVSLSSIDFFEWERLADHR